MPRKARILVPNCPHHIVQRGHNRNAVFVTDQDYQYYLENLKEWKEGLGIKIYGWCLMTNHIHIHIIAEPGQEAMDLSQLMKRVNGRQTAYVNKLERRSGSLWEGRYKASTIQRDAYLLNCCRYVELNPVRAGITKTAGEYPWSSYLERLGKNPRNLLEKDDSYMALGHDGSLNAQSYQAFLDAGLSPTEQQFITESFSRNQLTGDNRFMDEIEQRTGIRVERRGRGRPKNEEK